MIMRVKLDQIISARYNGDYTLEQQLCPPVVATTTFRQTENINNDERHQSILLSDLIEKYVQSNLNDGKWKSHSVVDHKSRITSLAIIIGDKHIDQFTRQDMRDFREILQRLPNNWRKIYNKHPTTIDKIIEQSESTKRLAIKTVNVHIEAVSTMFSWAIQEGLLTTANPAKGLGIKDEQPDIDKKEVFTRDDINKLFFCGDYKPTNFKKPSEYWCPLIALYTGMRLEEICQLHVEDIYKEDDLYVIDIRKESTDGLNDKILKTRNAIRKIPIHPDLINLGLIKYRNELDKNGEIRLFPELNKTKKSPKYGKQVGKFFSELVAKKEITGKKSFHSLRHTFADIFKKFGLYSSEIFKQVFGHEQVSTAAKVYGSRFTPKEIYEQVIILIDFNK